MLVSNSFYFLDAIWNTWELYLFYIQRLYSLSKKKTSNAERKQNNCVLELNEYLLSLVDSDLKYEFSYWGYSTCRTFHNSVHFPTLLECEAHFWLVDRLPDPTTLSTMKTPRKYLPNELTQRKKFKTLTITNFIIYISAQF